MGLGESENEKDSGGGGEGSVFCSICLEAVVVSGNGGRSTAKLLCGHDFHLDCIGSAFNVKGLMQCPNCRKTEKGNWLYANGYRPCPEVSMDERTHDEDLYDFSEQCDTKDAKRELLKQKGDRSIFAKISQSFLLVVAWVLWLSRNQALFKNARVYIENIWESIAFFITEWGRACVGAKSVRIIRGKPVIEA
ncbi:hypothetical protein QJS04_geneDACA019723 [Acorus gramineus]|uniref:RING-type domain-containing protein n=1 Tax=Acorus gramineus TaxID=55184 RepID=A0AAV9BZD0_ACOGR|nr:hypothetical protein QJS04_geneDACA019723 [Acorus gramineus]